jgi:hypothetical protein
VKLQALLVGVVVVPGRRLTSEGLVGLAGKVAFRSHSELVHLVAIAYVRKSQRSALECVMRRSPSIVPHGADQDTYLVLDDFGWRGCSWRETDAQNADRETLICDLVEGQYGYPIRVVAFNTAEGWSRDVTLDIADELRRRYLELGEVPDTILDFLDANRR